MIAPQRNRNRNLLVSSHEPKPLNQEVTMVLYGYIWSSCTCCMHTLVFASKITLLTFVFVIFSSFCFIYFNIVFVNLHTSFGFSYFSISNNSN